MILVSSPKKPFVLTAKLTARRQAVIADYEPEIDALYDRVAETAQAVKHFPNEWTEQTSLEFARNLIGSVLKVAVKDDDDIFQHSCDRSVHQPQAPIPGTTNRRMRNQFASNLDSQLRFECAEEYHETQHQRDPGKFRLPEPYRPRPREIHPGSHIGWRLATI